MAAKFIKYLVKQRDYIICVFNINFRIPYFHTSTIRKQVRI